MSKNPKTYVKVGNETVEGSLAPQDRTFRDAWQLDGDVIEVDMEKARNIQRDHIRQERMAEFLAADAEWFLASETDDATKKNEVKTKKQKLRDAPAHPSIADATTPEELKAVTLETIMAS